MALTFTRSPLCGLKQLDYEPFRYFLVNSCQEGIEIAVTGSARAYLLKEFDLVNLQIALRKRGGNFFSRGHISSIRTDTDYQTIYQISLLNEPAFDHPVYIALEEEPYLAFDSETSLREWLVAGIREWLLLKKGVLVYVRHLAAYFSRVMGRQHKSYEEFRRFFFDDIIQRLKEKIAKLNGVVSQIQQQVDTGLGSWLNFEENYELIASEVNLDLLNITFEEGTHLPYVIAIKDLESKLYTQFNTMLLVYEWFVAERAIEVTALLQKKIEEKAEIKIEERVREES